jgi:small subunit ribosomal protein S11
MDMKKQNTIFSLTPILVGRSRFLNSCLTVLLKSLKVLSLKLSTHDTDLAFFLASKRLCPNLSINTLSQKETALYSKNTNLWSSNKLEPTPKSFKQKMGPTKKKVVTKDTINTVPNYSTKSTIPKKKVSLRVIAVLNMLRQIRFNDQGQLSLIGFVLSRLLSRCLEALRERIALLPRYLYDQLIRLGWKVFLPLLLANVLAVVGLVLSFDLLAATLIEGLNIFGGALINDPQALFYKQLSYKQTQKSQNYKPNSKASKVDWGNNPNFKEEQTTKQVKKKDLLRKSFSQFKKKKQKLIKERKHRIIKNVLYRFKNQLKKNVQKFLSRAFFSRPELIKSLALAPYFPPGFKLIKSLTLTPRLKLIKFLLKDKAATKLYAPKFLRKAAVAQSAFTKMCATLIRIPCKALRHKALRHKALRPGRKAAAKLYGQSRYKGLRAKRSNALCHKALVSPPTFVSFCPFKRRIALGFVQTCDISKGVKPPKVFPIPEVVTAKNLRKLLRIITSEEKSFFRCLPKEERPILYLSLAKEQAKWKKAKARKLRKQIKQIKKQIKKKIPRGFPIPKKYKKHSLADKKRLSNDKPLAERKHMQIPKRLSSPLPIIFIQASINNTFLTLTDTKGNTLYATSAGKVGLKNARKSGRLVSQSVALDLGRRCRLLRVRQVDIRMRGIGRAKRTALTALRRIGLRVRYLTSYFEHPFNGCRSPKKRRV